MRRLIFGLLIGTITTLSAAQLEEKGKGKGTGEAAGYASRDASALSMMGWGVAIAAGIATLFALLDNNPAASGGHSH